MSLIFLKQIAASKAEEGKANPSIRKINKAVVGDFYLLQSEPNILNV